MSTSASTSTSTSGKLILKSNDGETFEVDMAVALESLTIKNMVEDVSADDVIPLPNVSGEILSKVMEYCKKHVETPKSDDDAVKEELKKFDTEFAKVEMDKLFELIVAANYLNIKGLLDLTCQTVADLIKDIKDLNEIRKMFNIENDFTPEEEEALRKENAWAFE